MTTLLAAILITDQKLVFRALMRRWSWRNSSSAAMETWELN